jgi:Putative auto-transporter adhesin, head GIN domain
MKLIFIYLLITGYSSVLAQQTVINDKNVETRDVTTFSGIKVSGGMEIYVSQSDNYSLAVSASEPRYRDNITTEVKNGILHISYNNDHFRLGSGDRKLRAYISFKTLESLEASGACFVTITGTLTAPSMLVKLSGACVVDGPVKIDDLTIDISGASVVKISGSATNVNLTASGASDVNNYDLVIQNCMAKLSGASDVSVTINNSVSGRASGASTLHYEGNPERKDIATSGASSISQRRQN